MLLQQWLTIVTICTLGAMSPGPSLGIVIRNTIQGTKYTGLATAIGHGIGVGIYAAISVLGLAVIITANEIIFAFIQILGALYLIWLGYNAMSSAQSAFEVDTSSDQVAMTWTKGFNTGFLIAFLNPKIAVFFLALFSQFVSADSRLIEKVLFAGTASIIDAVWYLFVALTISIPQITNKIKTHGVYFDRVLGLILVFVGIKLIMMSLSGFY